MSPTEKRYYEYLSWNNSTLSNTKQEQRKCSKWQIQCLLEFSGVDVARRRLQSWDYWWTLESFYFHWHIIEGRSTKKRAARRTQTRRSNPVTTHWMDPTSVRTHEAKCEASAPTVDAVRGASRSGAKATSTSAAFPSPKDEMLSATSQVVRESEPKTQRH